MAEATDSLLATKICAVKFCNFFFFSPRCHNDGYDDYFCLDGECRVPFARSSGAKEGSKYGEEQAADPEGEEDGEEEPLEKFFFTKEDGTPAGAPPPGNQVRDLLAL